MMGDIGVKLNPYKGAFGEVDTKAKNCGEDDEKLVE